MKMKITNRNENSVYFGNLGLGEVFIGDIGDEETDLLIRIEQNDCSGWNCVSLTDGTGYIFPPHEEVKLVEAELIYSEI